MSYPYTPFDPLVWLIFATFLVCVVLIVKAFHHRYPGYPRSGEKAGREAVQDVPFGTESEESNP